MPSVAKTYSQIPSTYFAIANPKLSIAQTHSQMSSTSLFLPMLNVALPRLTLRFLLLNFACEYLNLPNCWHESQLLPGLLFAWFFLPASCFALCSSPANYLIAMKAKFETVTGFCTRSPSSPLLPPFFAEGSLPEKTQKKGTLIPTSPLEDLGKTSCHNEPRMYCSFFSPANELLNC